MRPIIYPYKLGSGSARALSEELRRRGHRAKRVRPDGRYRPYRNHLIINWGNVPINQWDLRGVNFTVDILNKKDNVSVASDKLEAFLAMHEAGVRVPEFTTNIDDAIGWAQAGHDVVSRTILSGHSGRGIVMSSAEEGQGGELNVRVHSAPLYVKYIKKTAEYRIHVFRGQVIDIQQKRRRHEIPDEEVNWQIRNHANGFVYARDHVDEPSSDVLSQSIAAIEALGLDFGAVDVIWNSHRSEAYVLEVNTAPGLEGTTVSKYANAIEAIL